MIALRPIVAQDREAFQYFVSSLSPESRTNRFLYPVKELAPRSGFQLGICPGDATLARVEKILA